MKADLFRLKELWRLDNPSVLEISELFELCSKYPSVDLFEIINI